MTLQFKEVFEINVEFDGDTFKCSSLKDIKQDSFALDVSVVATYFVKL